MERSVNGMLSSILDGSVPALELRLLAADRNLRKVSIRLSLFLTMDIFKDQADGIVCSY